MGIFQGWNRCCENATFCRNFDLAAMILGVVKFSARRCHQRWRTKKSPPKNVLHPNGGATRCLCIPVGGDIVPGVRGVPLTPG